MHEDIFESVARIIALICGLAGVTMLLVVAVMVVHRSLCGRRDRDQPKPSATRLSETYEDT